MWGEAGLRFPLFNKNSGFFVLIVDLVILLAEKQHKGQHQNVEKQFWGPFLHGKEAAAGHVYHCYMPVMDGYSSAELIRKIDPEIPIVAITADAVEGVREKCRVHGMDQYSSGIGFLGGRRFYPMRGCLFSPSFPGWLQQRTQDFVDNDD